MAVVDGDILRFTLRHVLDNQQLLCVDYRRYIDVEGGGNTYAEIANDYSDAYVANIVQNWMVDDLVYQGVFLENVTNGIEFFDETRSQPGTATQDPAPTFVGVGVRQVRTTKVTRNGSKRLPGLSDAASLGNDLNLLTGQITAIETHFGANVLVGDGTIVNDAELQPVIVGRTLNPTTGVYELDLTRVNDVSSAVVTGVTSQVSRKRGQGI